MRNQVVPCILQQLIKQFFKLKQACGHKNTQSDTDLGDASLGRRLGEGVRLRLRLTSPFLALGPDDVGLVGPSSSEEDDPVSKTKETINK